MCHRGGTTYRKERLGAHAHRTSVERHGDVLLMFIWLLILVVLVVACAVLGAVYCYIYHRHINPTWSSRSHMTSGSAQAGGGCDDVTTTTTSNVATASTHLMLFRKS